MVIEQAGGRRHESGTSVRSQSIRNPPKRATAWRDWNIDSLRVTVFDGSAAKNRNRRRVRRALCHLGIDLSRHFFCHSIDHAVPNGRCAFLSSGSDYVSNCATASPAQIDVAGLENVAHRGSVPPSWRKRRRNNLGKVHRNRAGKPDRRNGTYLYDVARLANRNEPATKRNCLAGTGRRISRRGHRAWT